MSMLDADRPRRLCRSSMCPGVATGALVAVLVLAGCGDDDSGDAADTQADSDGDADTSSDPAAVASGDVTTTSVSVAVADAAIAAVVSALDAKNSLDLEGWLMAHEGGSRNGVPLFAEEILMNANQHWEVMEPCRITGKSAAGDTVVECLITNTDDFWGVGEIYEPRDLQFTVNPEGFLTTDAGVTNNTSFRSARRVEFNHAFHLWLSESHPDVYGDMDPGYISRSGPGFDTQNAEHMLTAVAYVEEFVAQSDDFPLAPSDS